MSRKRRNTSSPEASPEPPAKRHVPSPTTTTTTAAATADYDYDYDSEEDPDERPQQDQTSGQTGAFPGLGRDDDDGDGGMFYGPANDGIEYLRMVRSERRGVPSLLTAPRTSGIDELEQEQEQTQKQKQKSDHQQQTQQSADDEHICEETSGGYYADGAYTAVPSSNPSTSIRTDLQLSPLQLRSYEVLLAQFRHLQATLRCQPPLDKVQNLDNSKPISFPSQSAKAAKQWVQHVKSCEPDMVQVACMDGGSVFSLLGVLREEIERVAVVEEEGGAAGLGMLGAWLWAALAKVPDLGTLDGEEVSELRELAKAVVDVLERLESGETGTKHGEVTADESGADREAAEGGRQSNSSRVVLDMVITVVGEVYGQRDLLARRAVWKWKEKPREEGIPTQVTA